MPSAVIGSTHAWRSVARVGTHHIAAHLMRSGWSVTWLAGPVSPVHLAALRQPDVRTKLRSAVLPQRAPGLDARSPATLLPLGGRGYRSGAIVRHWQQATVPSLTKRLRSLPPCDLLLLDSPLYAFMPEVLTAGHVMFRLTDFTPGFPGMTEALLDLERSAVQRSDTVMVPTSALESYARSLGARSVQVVANGVDVERFTHPSPEPQYLRPIPHPRLAYVGTIREWFGYQLVEEVARRRPDVSIVLVGQSDLAASRLPRLTNLHLLGPRPHEEVPAILQACDVGWIPFDVAGHTDLIDRVDPLKLYEYLAAGLPVIATPWARLERLESPALLASTVDEVEQALDEALACTFELRVAGREFAKRFDWSARLGPLLAGLGVGTGPT